MRLIFIRHAEPDYKHDSLTEKGVKEAQFLSKRVANWKDEINKIYVSPLGRAQKTCSYSLEALGMTAETLPWLKEFYYPTTHPEQNNEIHVPWDFYPAYWTEFEEAYDKDDWTKLSCLSENDIEGEARNVFENFDRLLENYGYFREGGYYRHEGPKEEQTLVFFCHLGVSLLIIGHLLGISPFLLWHGIFVAPSSVSILSTEERDEGKAFFRAQVIGDTRHLSDNGELISKSGYFTDCFQG